MATQVKHRRGTAAEIAAGTPAIGELWFNTTDNTIHMGDGATPGGVKQSTMVNVKNYGAKGDGVTNDQPAIQAALDTGYDVYIPPGTYAVTSSLNPNSGQKVIGAGRNSTYIKAIGDNVITAFDFRGGSFFTLLDMTLNGNQANRTQSSGNGVLLQAENCTIQRVKSHNWPNSGILMDGQVNTCIHNTITDCEIIDNEGVGLSQHTTRWTKITNNRFRNNGKENLTIDNTSFACVVMGNTFQKHRGGCGCVGWDQADNVRFIGNILDGENATDAASDNRNGLCWNAVAGQNGRGVVVGNTFVNYPEYGINLRDRSGSGGFNAGGGEFSSNTFDNNGTDIRVTNVVQPLTIFQPNATFEILEAGSDLVLHPNAVSLDSQMSTNQTLPNDAAWHTVEFDTANESKNISVGSSTGKWDLPLGGKYQVYVKLRITGIGGSATSVSVAVNTGGTRTELINKTLDGTQTVAELTLSPNVEAGNGDISVEARILNAGTSATIASGGDSGFQLTYIG